MTIRNAFMITVLLAGFLFCSRLSAAEVHIAVAANFTDAMRRIAPLFEQTTGHTTRISYGSTGKLFSQIDNGAPFDVFLAADTRRPGMAEAQGLAVPGSGFIYASGKLMLWSSETDAFDDAESWLRQAHFRYLAIANPKTAPYGLAARQVLERLDIKEGVTFRLVRGDSIAQTFQFVATGNAEAGFVAASQVRAWRGDTGTSWEIPPDYYSPINQAATLLKKGRSNPAAQAFLDFLRNDSARAVIESYGYSTGQNTEAGVNTATGCCAGSHRPDPWTSTGNPSG